MAHAGNQIKTSPRTGEQYVSTVASRLLVNLKEGAYLLPPFSRERDAIRNEG